VKQRATAVPKVVKPKKVKNGKAGLEPGADKAPIIVPTQGEEAGFDKPADIDEDNEVPDSDTIYY